MSSSSTKESKSNRYSTTKSVDFSQNSNSNHHQPREKYLTAKYGTHQMNLIRKRLNVEMWIFDQLQAIFGDSEEDQNQKQRQQDSSQNQCNNQHYQRSQSTSQSYSNQCSNEHSNNYNNHGQSYGNQSMSASSSSYSSACNALPSAIESSALHKNGHETKAPTNKISPSDIEIDLDELLDIEDIDSRRQFLIDILINNCQNDWMDREKVQEIHSFIDQILEKAKTL